MRYILTICTAVSLLCSLPTHAEVSCAAESTSITASTPTANFILHDNGTATDKTTGLMWMRCTLGQAWGNNICDGIGNTFTWESALGAAHDVNSGEFDPDKDNAVGFAGYTDWRLPNKNELESIVEQRCYNPAINLAVFPDTYPIVFASSSSYVADPLLFWAVDFLNGGVDVHDKHILFNVRLVRGGQ